MPRASKRRRSEIVDTINAALEIVDDVAEDGDGDLVRAVIAAFALKEISEGNYEDDRDREDEDEDEDEDGEEAEEQEQAPSEDEEDGGEEEEEPEKEAGEEAEPPKASRGRSGSTRRSRAKK